MGRSRLGDILLRKKAISEEQLRQVQREMALNGDTLTTELVKQGVFTEND